MKSGIASHSIGLYAHDIQAINSFFANGFGRRCVDAIRPMTVRGKSVIQNLLNVMIVTLKSEGYTRLGVDFESFNPTAYGFWLKYFTAYTKGVARRIDDRILEVGV